MTCGNLTAILKKIRVFWHVTFCRLVRSSRRFGGSLILRNLPNCFNSRHKVTAYQARIFNYFNDCHLFYVDNMINKIVICPNTTQLYLLIEQHVSTYLTSLSVSKLLFKTQRRRHTQIFVYIYRNSVKIVNGY